MVSKNVEANTRLLFRFEPPACFVLLLAAQGKSEPYCICGVFPKQNFGSHGRSLFISSMNMVLLLVNCETLCLLFGYGCVLLLLDVN